MDVRSELTGVYEEKEEMLKKKKRNAVGGGRERSSEPMTDGARKQSKTLGEADEREGRDPILYAREKKTPPEDGRNGGGQQGGGKRNDAHVRTRVQREWNVLSSLPPSLLFSLSHDGNAGTVFGRRRGSTTSPRASTSSTSSTGIISGSGTHFIPRQWRLITWMCRIDCMVRK